MKACKTAQADPLFCEISHRKSYSVVIDFVQAFKLPCRFRFVPVGLNSTLLLLLVVLVVVGLVGCRGGGVIVSLMVFVVVA